MLTAAEVEPGQIMLVRSNMGHGEAREIIYRREPDRPTAFPYTVRVTRIRTMQGEHENKPRYDSGAYVCRDPGEMDGRTLVEDPWTSNWVPLVIEAVENLSEFNKE